MRVDQIGIVMTRSRSRNRFFWFARAVPAPRSMK